MFQTWKNQKAYELERQRAEDTDRRDIQRRRDHFDEDLRQAPAREAQQVRQNVTEVHTLNAVSSIVSRHPHYAVDGTVGGSRVSFSSATAPDHFTQVAHLQADYDKTRLVLDAELARLRAPIEAHIEETRLMLEHQREQLQSQARLLPAPPEQAPPAPKMWSNERPKQG